MPTKYKIKDSAPNIHISFGYPVYDRKLKKKVAFSYKLHDIKDKQSLLKILFENWDGASDYIETVKD